MKSLICFALASLLYCFQGIAQHIDFGMINIGSIDTIQSTVLNEPRRLWVHVPLTEPNSGERFPVVYLLDGSAHFPSVVGMIHQLSTINGNTIVPKMIVVGIPNTDRMRDLTPTKDLNMNEPNTSGGGEAFMDFLQKELMPYIDEKYPTSPYKEYIGHSLGGLTVINTLLKRPELFNSYIAIDPSLWWAESSTLKEASTLLNSKQYLNEKLFVGIANTMDSNMTINTVIKDTTQTTQHIRDILAFSKEVVPNSTSGLDFSYKYYSEDTHGSVPLISTYDGLRYIFEWYDIDNDLIPLIMNPESNAETVISKIESHYATVSNNMGYTILPDESLINQIGYGCLQNDLQKKAEAFFKLNVKNYPNSSNVYDSLGDYYAAVEQTDKAIEAYQKAMNTDGGNSYSQEKLDALKKGN